MRIIKTYNLNDKVVQDMNAKVRRRYRSKWVEEAIKEKLERRETFDLLDIPTWELLSHVEMTRWSKLSKAERAILREIWERLKEEGA